MIDKEELVVRQMKLNTGVEIIAVIESYDTSTIVLSHVVQYVESNNNGFGLKPWINVNDNISTQVILNANAIVATVVPDDTVKGYFLEAVSSLIHQEETFDESVITNTPSKDTLH